MDYEKLYKDTLERARIFKEHLLEIDEKDYADEMEYIFPELQESEDERIKKALIRFHKSSIDIDGIKGEDILAWLERQGKQKPILDFKAADWYVSKVDGKIHNIYNSGVKPKFKVGDFIVNDYCMGKVIELTDDAYLLDTEQGIPFSCEHNVHLWTIADAKDGDILAFNNDIIVIFKDLYNSSTFHSYCYIEDGEFGNSEDDMTDWWNGKGFEPATKEQYSLLFQKMHEAGYEWDEEKKELRKMEQKPKWTEEDGIGSDETIELLEYFINYAPEFRKPAIRRSIDWLTSLKKRMEE